MIQFLVVVGFFVLVSIVGAGLFYLIFWLAKMVVPGFMDSSLFVYTLGLLALAGTIYFAGWCINAVNRPWLQDRVKRWLRRD